MEYEILTPEERLAALREMWLVNERGYFDQQLIEECYRKVRNDATLKARSLKHDDVRAAPYLGLAHAAAQRVDQAIAGRFEMEIVLSKVKADHATLEPLVEQRRQEREAEAAARREEEERGPDTDH